jgi:hypothetical protein
MGATFMDDDETKRAIEEGYQQLCEGATLMGKGFKTLRANGLKRNIVDVLPEEITLDEPKSARNPRL